MFNVAPRATIWAPWVVGIERVAAIEKLKIETQSTKSPVAAAMTAGCEELWTNDERLLRALKNHIRIVPIDQFA